MSTVRIVAGVPLSEHLADRIREVDPGVELISDPALFPATRVLGDHHGPPPGFKRSADEQARYESLIDSADVLYAVPDGRRSALERAVATNKKLRWIHTQMAGGGAMVASANISDEDLQRVTFTTSAGVHADMLAEFTILGIFAGAKNLARLQAQQSLHEWPRQRASVRSVGGATLLIVGLGEIGTAIADRATALGMRVIGTKRTITDVPGVESVYPNDDLPQIVGEADHIVITLPGTKYTEGLFDADLLAKAKKGVNLINVGRGTVIDEGALIAALQSGQVGSAALDVFAKEPLAEESPLWDFPQVIVSPHSAALDELEEDRLVDSFIANLRKFLAGQPMAHIVQPELGY
ncbi:phosphoglycerate dehydrogenase-like enzyme [Antricoccus suffuscus]|uniref:Phosphoglycerate dehydrogenase-like enzyme n=1 Tax=Antricoccus suffuscus TaxID=1629062 RepID=A0A2T1A2X0_9ACTN|nr:D-2-hydroxyacid dehydrogenase [Antricoccus suffuscus]PRZ42959.1 phosphoglycerate dehydrogenase-like enzyme [Antricoccus suffuscus]